MPGSSLWLLPPSTHPLLPALTSLLHHTAALFSSPHAFLPHVTLTSDVAAATYGADPQAWLDGLAMPAASAVHVRLGALASEDVFVRKLYARVGKEGVSELGRACRRVVGGFEDEAEAGKWVEGMWRPHLSLLYHDCEVVGPEKMAEVEVLAKKDGVELSGVGEMGAWEGGRVVLVQTDRPVGEWKVIAERELK